MNPTLFLDIDGVMNNCRKAEIRPVNAVMLNVILQAVPETRIVISSRWRETFSLVQIREMMLEAGVMESARFGGVTPDLSVTLGSGVVAARSRWDEIREWLNLNPHSTFCILDDSCDGMPPAENYVQTEWKNGLQYDDALKVIEVLLAGRAALSAKETNCKSE